MKRVAFSLWNGRIAPVFDVARHILIVSGTDGCETGRLERRFASDNPQERALRLASMQVEQLVCGAISRSAADALQQNGIQIVSFVSGDAELVIEAWLHDHLCDARLAMPGCGRKQRVRRRKPSKNGCNMHRKE